MDVISLGKAKKALRDMENYHKKVLGEGAEAHFSSIDARLDYLEKQLTVQDVERTLNLIHSISNMTGTEIDESGKLKLKYHGLDEDGNHLYNISGSYEKVFDLGPALLDFKSNVLKATKAANHTVTVKVSESDDGITFTEPVDWSDTYKPSKRFIKVKIELVSTDTFHSKEEILIELEDNDFITEENLLLRKEDHIMSFDPSWSGEGSLHRQMITRDEWVRIDKLEVASP